MTRSIRKWIRTKILAWPHSTITWEAVRAEVRKKHPEAEAKRQTLAKYEELQSAFYDTKRRLLLEREQKSAKERAAEGKPAKPGRPKAGTDEYLRNRVAFLETRVRELETENTRLKQQFVRWQRNAIGAGMTLQQLERPHRRIDRGQADE
ncbi:hypothetical protein NLM33_39435 [Bradyrhizobium sp. CCGUVB1N3]|uniref:hypothetical protein n=1 Tax=Bradyrhizobium sp. CCGUVB1N3 TaxID=2949629 RepID=UPI0020B300BC|nr:hypothetical protein [Bradyrhizobium sp. CCGUVB1N3]MCP3476294.1 hypothetical protein [Bradyrhizobium sp. CCGUVB1N3]